MKTFTTDWFTHNIPNWKKWLSHLVGEPVEVLEIGCWEGRATCWLLENVLTHKESTILTIDTFQGSAEHAGRIDTTALLYRFQNNVASCESEAQVMTYRGQSFDMLPGIIDRREGQFDFIYIDGSHKACDVLSDAVMSWMLLKPGGILIFDDYHWTRIAGAHNQPRIAIDAFFACYVGQYDLIHVGHQVCLRKSA